MDRLLFAHRRRLRKHCIKRTIFLAALLYEINILALLLGNPHDAEIWQQAKLTTLSPATRGSKVTVALLNKCPFFAITVSIL